MEPQAFVPCYGNCLVHLHSRAGEAWLQRHACPYEQRLGPNGTSYFRIVYNNAPLFLSAHGIHTFYIRSNVEDFERQYRIRVKNVAAVIPASINPGEYKSQLSAAAASAGVRIVHFSERSVLAATYYESLCPPVPRTVLVFELGGPFFEISLLTENPFLNIVAAVYDLGCPLFNHMVSLLSTHYGCDITGDAIFLHVIRTECERAKGALCLGSANVEIKIQGLDMVVTTTPINRESLVQMNLDHIRSGITRCLTQAGVGQEAVGEVVLAGASSTLPEVVGVLREFFQLQQFRCDIDPAQLIELSFHRCVLSIAEALNTPVICLRVDNLGIYSL